MFAHSKGGMVGAVTLGLGRAMGETIAAALVIGSNPQITAKLFAPGYSMPSVIANEFGESSGLWRSALIGLGVMLFVITIIVNLAARAVVNRSIRRTTGRMTTTLTAPAGASAGRPERRSARDASFRNGLATVLMGLSLVVVAHPARLRARSR